ncbi:Aminopeptidase 2 mitochondrial [Clarireedia jacksonii]
MTREQHNAFTGQSSGDSFLPKNVKPTHYELQVIPDLENAQFEAMVFIDFDVASYTESIALHAVDLDIRLSNLVMPSGERFAIDSISYDALRQTILISLPKELGIFPGGKFRLELHYMGRVNERDSAVGLYRSSFKDKRGNTSWIASTQMQPTGARRLLPCVDEPAAKATFSVSLITDDELVCVGNMDILSEKELEPLGIKKLTTFNTTPPMSTYLIAFVVGKFDWIETNSFRVPVRIYAPENQNIDNCFFALQIAAQAMEDHERTFGIEYPLPKLDMAAIPGHTGAMENWGCVIYDHRYLFVGHDASAESRQAAAETIVHELAHQWFGNIVTLQWWDSTWLNEAFAEWATYNALENMFPKWHAWDRFVTSDPLNFRTQGHQEALHLDSNFHSHPIEVPVNSPGQANQIFDAITYYKGCAILRMLSSILGVETFIKGVRLHLRRHTYGNATTEDLWDSLTDSSGIDVRAIMAPWTRTTGYPVLDVEEDPELSSISVVQHRFLQNTKPDSKDDQAVWPVFLMARSTAGHETEMFFQKREHKFSMSLDFYKLNANSAALYRVSYPLERYHNFSQLLQQSNSSLLSPADKVNLISDFLALTISGTGPGTISDFLHFLNHFRHENNFFVWRQIIYSIRTIQKAFLFSNAKINRSLERFQVHLLSSHLSDDFWDESWDLNKEESLDDDLTYSLLFAAASSLPRTRAAAHTYFESYVKDSTPIDPNLRKTVFDIVLEDAHEIVHLPTIAVFPAYLPHSRLTTPYGILYTILQQTTHPELRSDILNALGHASIPAHMQRTLALYTDRSMALSKREQLTILASLQSHAEGVVAVWAWMRKHWEELMAGPQGISGAGFVKTGLEGLATGEQLREVEVFFGRRDCEGFDMMLQQVKDDIKTKALWTERDAAELEKWLVDNGFWE